MSHFTRIRTKLRHLGRLEKALRDLGYTPSRGNVAVRGWDGHTRPADLVVPQANGYDFGFKQEGDELVLIADVWGFRGDLGELVGRITQQYAYQICVEQAEGQGFRVTGSETLADGSIKLTVERYT